MEKVEYIIPKGYGFFPTEEDLISHYLYKKTNGEDYEDTGMIVERRLYDAEPWNVLKDEDPWLLVDGNPNKKVLYVFCKQIPLKSGRVSRTAGCGTWEGKAVPQNAFNPQRTCVIGQKRQLTFKAGKGFEAEVEGRGHWIMHEFCLPPSMAQDYVICRIYKSGFDAAQDSDHVVGSGEVGEVDHGKRKFGVVNDSDYEDNGDEGMRMMKKHKGIIKDEISNQGFDMNPSMSSNGASMTEGVISHGGFEESMSILGGYLSNYQDYAYNYESSVAVDFPAQQDHDQKQDKENQLGDGGYLSSLDGLSNADDDLQVLLDPNNYTAPPSLLGSCYNLFVNDQFKQQQEENLSFFPEDDKPVVRYSTLYGSSSEPLFEKSTENESWKPFVFVPTSPSISN